MFDDKVDFKGETFKIENVDSKKIPRYKVTLRWCRYRSCYLPIKEWYANLKATREWCAKDTGP